MSTIPVCVCVGVLLRVGVSLPRAYRLLSFVFVVDIIVGIEVQGLRPIECVTGPKPTQCLHRATAKI